MVAPGSQNQLTLSRACDLRGGCSILACFSPLDVLCVGFAARAEQPAAPSGPACHYSIMNPQKNISSHQGPIPLSVFNYL